MKGEALDYHARNNVHQCQAPTLTALTTVPRAPPASPWQRTSGLYWRSPGTVRCSNVCATLMARTWPPLGIWDGHRNYICGTLRNSRWFGEEGLTNVPSPIADVKLRNEGQQLANKDTPTSFLPTPLVPNVFCLAPLPQPADPPPLPESGPLP